MRGCAMSCFQASWLSPRVHPADATSLDFSRASATQQAPELFRSSMCVSHWAIGERFAATIQWMDDASHAWSSWHQGQILSYQSLAHASAMTSPWVSAIFCPYATAGWARFLEPTWVMEQIPSKDALARAPCIDSMAAVESLDRIPAG